MRREGHANQPRAATIHHVPPAATAYRLANPLLSLGALVRRFPSAAEATRTTPLPTTTRAPSNLFDIAELCIPNSALAGGNYLLLAICCGYNPSTSQLRPQPSIRKMLARNVVRQDLQPREIRWHLMGQRPAIAWLTGLSGAGKSTIANIADRTLTETGHNTMVLDGDNLRLGLNRDLGFTAEDRVENIRRAAETARLMAEAGLVVIVSLISPFRAERAAARAIAGDIPFLEVFINTPLSVCESRDPKGLYDRARAGKIPNFTGISAPYECPDNPDLVIETRNITVEQSSSALIAKLTQISRPSI